MTSRPRREWKSFLWLPRWSVRLRIRSDRIATCTSGDPVSPDLTAYSPISVCLRSGVIDIDLFPSTVYDPHRPQPACLDPGQRDEKLLVPRADDRPVLDMIEARLLTRILRPHSLAVTQPGGFGCRQGEGRDVVQRRLDWQQMLGSIETMPKGQCRIQRNRLHFIEAADREPPQFGDMAERAERLREVASERTDVGAPADRGYEIGVIGIDDGDQT